MNTNGSEWRKWDLHFHTPSSYDYKNKSVTNQQIIDGLESKNISVVAITDHHKMDVCRIIELQKLAKSKNITVLPGIEFLSDARGNEPIHFIAIFSESSNTEYIWKQIENRTEIRKIIAENKKENEIYCDLIDTIKLVRELNGIITIHAGNKSNSIENITHSLPQGIAQKIDIAKEIDIFEMGKVSDIAEYSKKVLPFLKKDLGKVIPMIICSDNHDIANYEVKENLWIKADQTFEGLKQIIFEPEQRVKIQREKPDFKENKLIIGKLKFIPSDNKFTKHTIYLNDNLNVIIGGKSSGKSILLYSIAKTLLADQAFLAKEHIETKYDFRNNDSAFNFEVTTKGGFSQLMHRATGENSIIPEIKYIPQNYLVRLAEPDDNKTGNALNKMVRNLINEDSDSKQHYDNFISVVKANDKRREAIIDNYFEIKDKLTTLESQLRLKSSRSVLEENIRVNTLRVEELNKSSGMTDEQIATYNSLQNESDKNKLERTKAGNDFGKIRQFNNEAYNTLISLKNKKNLINSSLEDTKFKAIFENEFSKIDDLIKSINEFTLLFELDGNNTFKSESAISKIFLDFDVKQTDLNNQIQPYLRNQAIKDQIENIIKSINEDKAAVQSIEQLNKEIAENKEVSNKEKAALFELYEENYSAYLKVIDALKSRTEDLKHDGLKIEGKVKFNFKKFQKSLKDISDGRAAHYAAYDICKDTRDSLDEYELSNIIDDLKTIFVSIVETGSYALISKTNKKNAIRTLLDDYFFDYWQIEYKSDRLGKMSTGKASFVILMLIVGLSKSKAPILIDQPEDNLDNRSITSDLVEYLKNKKIERQIILVTHNANIVVNADAENVIIANQRGQGDIDTNSPYQFDYINGALENTFPYNENEKDLLKSMGIREHIADIVEGGKDAFKKREEKYGFKTFA